MISKDIGFVIRRHNFRETSVIASIYTSRFGKITGIFKGFYTQKKEFSTPLDVFTLNEFVFYPKKREIWLVSFADFIYDFYPLRDNFNKSRMGVIFLNLVDKTMPLWDSNPEVFFLLRQCLLWLCEEDERRVLYVFLIKFLTVSGFKPQFDHCIICHNNLSGEEVFFSVSKGGLVCGDCRHTSNDSRRITKEALACLFYIQRADFPGVNRLKISSASEKEILSLLRSFLLYHLDYDIFSKLYFN